jgi:hypothetical protein
VREVERRAPSRSWMLAQAVTTSALIALTSTSGTTFQDSGRTYRIERGPADGVEWLAPVVDIASGDQKFQATKTFAYALSGDFAGSNAPVTHLVVLKNPSHVERLFNADGSPTLGYLATITNLRKLFSAAGVDPRGVVIFNPCPLKDSAGEDSPERELAERLLPATTAEDARAAAFSAVLASLPDRVRVIFGGGAAASFAGRVGFTFEDNLATVPNGSTLKLGRRDAREAVALFHPSLGNQRRVVAVFLAGIFRAIHGRFPTERELLALFDESEFKTANPENLRSYFQTNRRHFRRILSEEPGEAGEGGDSDGDSGDGDDSDDDTDAEVTPTSYRGFHIALLREALTVNYTTKRGRAIKQILGTDAKGCRAFATAGLAAIAEHVRRLATPPGHTGSADGGHDDDDSGGERTIAHGSQSFTEEFLQEARDVNYTTKRGREIKRILGVATAVEARTLASTLLARLGGASSETTEARTPERTPERTPKRPQAESEDDPRSAARFSVRASPRAKLFESGGEEDLGKRFEEIGKFVAARLQDHIERGAPLRDFAPAEGIFALLKVSKVDEFAAALSPIRPRRHE